MNKIAAVFVTATLLLNAMAPTLAYTATYLQGAEVNANTLIQDAYVAVTYYDSKNKQTLYKGWIDAIDETTFRIRSGALFGKKTIAYDKVLSVIMGEEATPRGKQINEVNRFIQEMEKRELRAKETEQAAIQRLSQKTVTVMPRGQIDPSEITKGWYADIVYTSEGATRKVTSQIADKDSNHIALKYGADTYNIAYNDIDTLIIAKHLREIKQYRETGAKYNVRVRVYAPSIQKAQMVGKLIKMAQDTLVIQRATSQQVRTISSRRIRTQEGIQQRHTTFYQVPISSISHIEISMGQYRNIGKGLIIGLGVGAVMTILINISDPKTNLQGLGQAYATLIVLPSIAVISTLIGGITKSDKWVAVSPQRLNLSFAPLPAWPRPACLLQRGQAGPSGKGLRAALTFNF